MQSMYSTAPANWTKKCWIPWISLQTAFFKIPKNPSTSLAGMTSFTSPVPFTIWAFIMTSVIVTSFPHERDHLRSMCTPTRALSRKVASLNKPKDEIQPTKNDNIKKFLPQLCNSASINVQFFYVDNMRRYCTRQFADLRQSIYIYEWVRLSVWIPACVCVCVCMGACVIADAFARFSVNICLNFIYYWQWWCLKPLINGNLAEVTQRIVFLHVRMFYNVQNLSDGKE